MPNRVAIVGVGQTYHKSKRPDASYVELASEAVREALADAELEVKDIDTVILSNMEMFEGNYLVDKWLFPELGFVGKPGLHIQTAGTSGVVAACAGFHHVASGHFGTALVVGAQKHDESVAQTVINGMPYWTRHFSAGAIGNFARRAVAYMASSGCTEEHFALTRIKQAKCAMRNPRAHLRLNLTMKDIMQSRMLVWPIRLTYMGPASTGAAALVIASEERAKALNPKKRVWAVDWVVKHLAQAVTYAEQPDVSTLEDAGIELYKRNGITDPPREIDVFEFYEPASNAELKWMEELHICDHGTAWKLIEKEKTGIEGDLPVNPSGGVTSCNPISASPIVRIVETALQVRGDAGEHQVSRPVRTALANGYGGGGENGVVLLRKSL